MSYQLLAPHFPCATPIRPDSITKDTRWNDAQGRAWRILENLHFGRYLCVLDDRPSYSGEWTAKEIRAAIRKAIDG